MAVQFFSKKKQLPTVIPKHVISVQGNKPMSKPITTVNAPMSSKLGSSCIEVKNYVNNNVDSYITKVPFNTVEDKVHCSVPNTDLRCFVTNSSQIDTATRKIFNYQTAKKIYTTPSTNNSKITPKKCPNDSGMQVNEKIRQTNTGFKLNSQF